MRPAPEPGRREAADALKELPRLRLSDPLDFACAGCGGCCRGRDDVVLSGYDLYRLARWTSLPPRMVAKAFCVAYAAPDTGMPVLRLRPDAKTRNCPFFEANSCAVHPARPLACALYPLGQAIDPDTGKVEYYLQPPLCGVPAGGRTLEQYLKDSGVADRQGIDARWAVVCTQLADQLLAAGGAEIPAVRMAGHRIADALYYDYSLREEFYPQFQQNLLALEPVLNRLLSR